MSRFVELVAAHAGREVPLDQAAAALAVDEDPEADLDDMLGQLDELAAGVRMPPRVTPVEAVARLNHHLFQEHQFHGDAAEYDHPRNSLLHRVLDRRQGLPILLSLVYVEVARRVGVEIRGVGFPRHFIVRPLDADPPFFIDAFHQGRVLRPELLGQWLDEWFEGRLGPAEVARMTAPIDSRTFLFRICNNLKLSFLRRDDAAGALRQVERLLALDPGDVEELRDRGLLRSYLGLYDKAVADLEAYLERAPDAPDSYRIVAHLDRIRGRETPS